MTDRLAEIRARWTEWPYNGLPVANADVDWLVAELAVLRAQRDAALAVCDEVLREYPGMGRGGIALDVRAALGVQPEPDNG